MLAVVAHSEREAQTDQNQRRNRMLFPSFSFLPKPSPIVRALNVLLHDARSIRPQCSQFRENGAAHSVSAPISTRAKDVPFHLLDQRWRLESASRLSQICSFPDHSFFQPYSSAPFKSLSCVRAFISRSAVRRGIVGGEIGGSQRLNKGKTRGRCSCW